MQKQNFLQLKQLCKSFGKSSNFQGVKNVSIDFEPGEGFSLLGPSGCGKTTTLRMIGGFEKPDSGSIHLRDQEITHLPAQDRDIRTVFQKYALFPHLNVYENIVFGLRIKKLKEQELQAKAARILDIIQIPHLALRRIDQLCGGEQQRVALARALITEPSILLLDEPLSALDLKLREQLGLELLSLRKKVGTTFIFVTHDQNEAMVLSDRVGVMRQGELLQVGSPSEIYNKPKNHFVANFIGKANFVSPDALYDLHGNKNQLPDVNSKEMLMIRPESFDLCAKSELTQKNISADGSVGYDVKVMESVFLGSYHLIKVSDAKGKEYVVKSSPFKKGIPNIGEDAFMSWKASNSWVVECEQNY